MRLEFHPEAEFEYREATDFYTAARPGLGARFTFEIEAVLELVCDAPTRWRKFEQDVRRCLVRRFPYAVLYNIEDDFVLIIAVMHCSREPGYWRARRKSGDQ